MFTQGALNQGYKRLSTESSHSGTLYQRVPSRQVSITLTRSQVLGAMAGFRVHG